MKLFQGIRALGALPIVALGTLSTGSEANAAGMLRADGGLGGNLAITEHSARVTVNNGIAVTEVSQVFKNEEDRIVEALYTFPVPIKASVSNFSMWIDGKEMVGEVVEKERAREIYESYKQVRRDPGLLEQTDYKTFQLRIFPIAANAEQRIQIVYYQQLDFDNDWATYVYPLATTTGGEGIDQRVEGKFALTVDVKSEVPITTMQSPSHADAFVMVDHSDTYHEASLEQPDGSLAKDLVVAYQVGRPRTGIDIVTSKPGGEDGYFYLTLTPGDELSGDAVGADYVFVLDISGSMGRDGKLELSGNSIGAFVEALGDNDRFEVMSFNVRPETLFNELRPVDAAAKSEASEFLKTRRAAGGTELQSALRGAFNYADKDGDRPLNLVVLSDGLAKDADRRTLMDAAAACPKNSRIFCVGVGNDINRPLLTQIAEDAGGLAAFLSRGDDFERQAEAFRRKLTRPVATNVSIDFRGLEVYDLEPKQLPNLYHGMPVRLYGRYKGAGPVAVNLKADVQGFGLNQTLDFKFPETDASNPEIERMWAFSKTQRLIEAMKNSGDRGTVDEIVRLGEGYSIVTEFTSFLVLENDAEYRRWNIDRKNAIRITRDRKAQAELRAQLDSIKAQASNNLGPNSQREKVARNQTAPSQSGRAPIVRDTTSVSNPSPGDVVIPDSGGSSGGGAIDPFSGLLVLGLAGLAAAKKLKRN